MARWVVLVALVVGCSNRAPKYSAEEWQRIHGHEEKGNEAFELGKLDVAAEHYDWLIDTYPKVVSSTTLAKRAAVYFLEHDYEAGLEFIDRVALPLAKHPEGLYEYRALTLWALGRQEEAIADADKAARLNRRAYQAHLLRGMYYFGRDPSKAAAALNGYLTYRPPSLAKSDGMPRIKLGLAYLKIGEAQRAEEQFELVTEQFRDDERIVINAKNGLCAAYAANDKFHEAIAVCEYIVSDRRRIDRGGSAYYNLARSYFEVHRPADALVAAREYVTFNPRHPKTWRLLADVHLVLRNCDEAERAMDKAVEVGDGELSVEARRHTVQTCREAPASERRVPPPQPSPSRGEGVSGPTHQPQTTPTPTPSTTTTPDQLPAE